MKLLFLCVALMLPAISFCQSTSIEKMRVKQQAEFTPNADEIWENCNMLFVFNWSKNKVTLYKDKIENITIIKKTEEKKGTSDNNMIFYSIMEDDGTKGQIIINYLEGNFRYNAQVYLILKGKASHIYNVLLPSDNSHSEIMKYKCELVGRLKIGENDLSKAEWTKCDIPITMNLTTDNICVKMPELKNKGNYDIIKKSKEESENTTTLKYITIDDGGNKVSVNIVIGKDGSKYRQLYLYYPEYVFIFNISLE